MSANPEVGPRCGECRLGLGTHNEADPLCDFHDRDNALTPPEYLPRGLTRAEVMTRVMDPELIAAENAQRQLESDRVHAGFTTDLADERTDVLTRFTAELAKATGDGSKKRRAGTKPPWYADDSHEAAIFSHLTKWKRGELVDPDSGAHPMVHAAWRCLAIACRESGNTP